MVDRITVNAVFLFYPIFSQFKTLLPKTIHLHQNKHLTKPNQSQHPKETKSQSNKKPWTEILAGYILQVLIWYIYGHYRLNF